ncbi:MAG: hypothetical protein ACE5GN_06100 [Waddliaceae bacterium]
MNLSAEIEAEVRMSPDPHSKYAELLKEKAGEVSKLWINRVVLVFSEASASSSQQTPRSSFSKIFEIAKEMGIDHQLKR